MKKYNIINDSLGWLCFIIAAVTYILTLEPTASFWDCPEFILQGFKLEIGHPPGNPIFMLAARFFINFVGGDVTMVAYAVNFMSALLSAGTILLLFWTITHLVRKLIVKDGAEEISPVRMLVIFGSGICGALAYTWSDTFWFSAVEGEVYAFSSFCTALVFWLILKWENRADLPHSDKYLILIAYVIGISIAVHLLNLLCIPAIVLVIYYKKWHNPTAKGSLLSLLVSFVIVALILYGLVPGFIEVSQYFELFFVNVCGAGYNMGVLFYAILLVACFIWAIRELYAQKSPMRIRLSFMLSVLLSGIPFIGSNLLIPVLFMVGLGIYLFKCKVLPIRILNLVTLSIFVIFIGYSSYALLLIRSSAHTPMNQNAPDNVFALSSYLNREQYGETPLFYGQTLNSRPLYEVNGYNTNPVYDETTPLYAKKIKKSPSDSDEYVLTGYKRDYKMNPELNMVFPRIHSGADGHPAAYAEWIGLKGEPVNTTMYVDSEGNPLQKQLQIKPTFAENMRFFLTYQLNHMYWRYFMWNFAGRQNDIQGNGEVNKGNWISGIPFIDNPRLGDQSLLPYEQGEGNKGHNVFYMLPLLLGLLGLCWQAFTSKRGIEQFWVVFFLFFMTGIAIVLYLNQVPIQPRERDYSFAGSFYAFAIWIGMGVAALWRICVHLSKDKKNTVEAPNEEDDTVAASKVSVAGAVVATLIGLIVPLQMVSQTWDDHDRSGRYAARDFGQNYLNSLDENAVIFTNGDNDTFPLWYAQEVEGTRTDVKVVNLSYLTTDWYVNQVRRQSYEAAGLDMLADPQAYAYDKMQFNYFMEPDSTPVNALASLKQLYSPESQKNSWGVPVMKYPNMFIPVDTAAMVKAGRITEAEAAVADPVIPVNMLALDSRGMTLSEVIFLDILATSAKNGWNRPVYVAMTVPERYYLGLSPYMRSTGLAYEVGPIYNPTEETGINTDKMYRNITERFRWGGLDKVSSPDDIYLDETVRRMVTTNRSAMVELSTALINEAVQAEVMLHEDSVMGISDPEKKARLEEFKSERYEKAREILDLMREKLPVAAMPYSFQVGQKTGELYLRLALATGDPEAEKTGLDILSNEIDKFAGNVVYYQSLSPIQYQTLERTDKYIDRIHFMDLIQSYVSGGGDVEELEKRLTARGVDLNRQTSFNN